jgi:hypothetical protein
MTGSAMMVTGWNISFATALDSMRDKVGLSIAMAAHR